MKIIIAVHHFPPKYTSGAELRAFRTAQALQKRGYEVRAVCVENIDKGPDGGVTWRDEIYDGVPVRRLSFNLESAPDPFRWSYDNLWIGDHLSTMLANYKPDIFHLVSGYIMSGRALHAAYRHNIPTVLSLTDFWFLCPRITMLRSDGHVSTLPIDPVQCSKCLAEEQRRYRLPGQYAPKLTDVYWKYQHGHIERIQDRLNFLHDTLNQVNAIISPSQFLRSLFIETGTDPNSIIFSRQGHDFSHVSSGLLQKIPSDTLRIGYVGQIAPHKGVHVLFEAVRLLPNANVMVKAYGDATPFPSYTAQLQKLATHDERLELAGVYQRKNVSKVLQELDVIVVPSVWYENSPNSMLESFAHKTPVIASDLGGMAELVLHGQNGLLFEVGNPNSLAEQLQHLLDESDLLLSLRSGITPIKSTTQELDELEAIYHHQDV
ncbi:MAG: hypothetical protein B6242_03135 [Anaerolineaceae bacterium 4572_78]|nr:MAG: hypothetical protein B6242_03135 [Anaerolineaceae bacterium 4572_78]